MNQPSSTNRTWKAKFGDAFRGLRNSMGGSSFTVHRLMAIAVLVCAVVFQVDRWEWCVLYLCIAIVMAAEVFNSAIESLSLARSKP